MLNVVTPCSRPANLPLIKPSVSSLKSRYDGPVMWWIVVDRMDPFSTVEALETGFMEADWMHVVRHDGQGAWGHEQRNFILDNPMVEGLVVFVDDDTVVHPDYAPDESDLGQVVVTSQCWGDGNLRLRAEPGCLWPGSVDTGMVTFDRSLVGEVRFPLQYDGDGHFFTELGVRNSDKIVYRPTVQSYYNLLR